MVMGVGEMRGALLDWMVRNGLSKEVTFSLKNLSSEKSFNQPMQEWLFLKPAFLQLNI